MVMTRNQTKRAQFASLMEGVRQVGICRIQAAELEGALDYFGIKDLVWVYPADRLREQKDKENANLDYWGSLPSECPWIEVRRRDQVAHLDKINRIVEQLPETRNEGWTLCDHFMDTNWWDDVKWSNIGVSV